MIKERIRTDVKDSIESKQETRRNRPFKNDYKHHKAILHSYVLYIVPTIRSLLIVSPHLQYIKSIICSCLLVNIHRGYRMCSHHF